MDALRLASPCFLLETECGQGRRLWKFRNTQAGLVRLHKLGVPTQILTPRKRGNMEMGCKIRLARVLAGLACPFCRYNIMDCQGLVESFTTNERLIFQDLYFGERHFCKGRSSLLLTKRSGHTTKGLGQRSKLNSRPSFSVNCSGSSRDNHLEQALPSSQGTSNSVSTTEVFEGRSYLPPHSSEHVNTIEEEQHKPKYKPKRFKNKYLGLVRLGSLINNAAESFFKSEIRRRLFVTVVLVMASRVGYFIPLPGFDRRLIPEDYLGFVSGSVEELGDLSAELKLSLFQLGISPYIFASILMQVLCHFVPALIKLRKEGLDGNEKIKRYIWWLSLAVAILESIMIAYHSLPYSVYAATHMFQHVFVTTLLLTTGSMVMIWICEKISQDGFGHGSSLIICAGILTGYSDTLYKMLTRLSSSGVNWVPYILVLLGVFIFVTMWAVLVTEGLRKVKLQYYAFKLAPSVGEGASLPEVEPYIPFNINPTGMQPVLTTTYVLALPSILASFLQSPFWERARDILNPATTATSSFKPWVYYSLHAFFIFSFNLLDIANMPKEMTDYMIKMGARVPNIKPGHLTTEYLAKIQASTRFWGGLLLSLLATLSTLVDHHFRHINEGFAIGFTSILIIVGSIIELRRSYQAYNVMPTLSKVLKRYGV